MVKGFREQLAYQPNQFQNQFQNQVGFLPSPVLPSGWSVLNVVLLVPWPNRGVLWNEKWVSGVINWNKVVHLVKEVMKNCQKMGSQCVCAFSFEVSCAFWKMWKKVVAAAEQTKVVCNIWLIIRQIEQLLDLVFRVWNGGGEACMWL